MSDVSSTDRTTYLKSKIRDVPDFPKPGIIFKDITPMLGDARAHRMMLGALAERFSGEPIDAILGIEARGFIFGSALAQMLDVGFVPARKPGKLPAACDRVRFDTEYSSTELELHKGSFKAGAKVIIVDDVLATGGTAKAAAQLVAGQGAVVSAYAFAIELDFLGGRAVLGDARIESILRY